MSLPFAGFDFNVGFVLGREDRRKMNDDVITDCRGSGIQLAGK